jgi:hypothetical protein
VGAEFDRLAALAARTDQRQRDTHRAGTG